MAYLDNFHSAPPGVSLTQPPGQWQWEKPPRFTRPIDAVDFVTSKFKNPDIKENYIKMMMAGISVEEIVTSITKGGFMTGNFSPDVAEIIKNPLTFFILGMADDYGIPVRLYRGSFDSNERQADEMIDDDTLLSLMRRRNPQLYALYQEKELERMERDMRPRGGGMLEEIAINPNALEMEAPIEGQNPEIGSTFAERPPERKKSFEQTEVLVEEPQEMEEPEEEMMEESEENNNELL